MRVPPRLRARAPPTGRAFASAPPGPRVQVLGLGSRTGLAAASASPCPALDTLRQFVVNARSSGLIRWGGGGESSVADRLGMAQSAIKRVVDRPAARVSERASQRHPVLARSGVPGRSGPDGCSSGPSGLPRPCPRSVRQAFVAGEAAALRAILRFVLEGLGTPEEVPVFGGSATAEVARSRESPSRPT